jgi:serine/threonine protein kinase
MAFEVGDIAGDYQIIGILGAGGMGKVYKVRNTISDRVEAMKVLLPNLAEAPELADRFVREIKLLASLNHPNIAALHTALRLENQLLMIMEFVEGRSLEDRLKDGGVTIWEAVDYMSQVLSALAYAHERGVVHRDIKPANIMVCPAGEVKLMDFGIAKAMADRRLTQTGTTLGSLYYMSPEQVRGSAELDGRADLYSVGVALYEIVTGQRPFKGDSDYSIMVAHLQQAPVPPIQVDPTLPPSLNEIIMTAIEKEPGARFQSAQAFRGALENVKQTLAKPGQAQARPVAPAPAPPPAGATQTAGVVYPAAPPPPPPPPRQAAPPPPPQPQFQQMQAPPPVWAQPPAPPIPPPPPPQSSGGHRGLYMALGALIVVGVLALAAIQGPKWYRAIAGGEPEKTESQPVEGAPEAAAQPAGQQAQPAAGTATLPPVETQPAATTQGVKPAGSASALTSTQPGRERRTVQPPPPPPGDQQPVQPAQNVRPVTPPPPPVDTQALEKAEERLGMIGVRANAVRGTLQNLEQQQRSQGLGLRGDISASWKRMELLLDQAEAAIKRQDPVAAKRYLDQADRETDKLENFLGR